jgi:hypothetical protein
MTEGGSRVEECLRGLPRTLKIGAYDWSVMLLAGDDANCGQADFETHHLNLWPKNLTSPSHAVGIILHECLHVIFDNHGLVKMKRDKEEREEAIIVGFEAGLVSLFRDNPKFLTWMKKWLR